MIMKRILLTLIAVLMVPGLAWAQTDTRATFLVKKDFDDDNPAAVEMNISCNTGLPLDQSKMIVEQPEYVEFVEVDFDSGTMDCTVTETPVAGYITTYSTNGGDTFSSEPCTFENVEDGDEYTCDVYNEPAPVDLVISKEFVFVNGDEGDDDIDLDFELRLYCDDNVTVLYEESRSHDLSLYGEGDTTFTVAVQPTWEGGSCYITESLDDSAVEGDTSDCQDLQVSIGSGDSCTVTNTVFFEGIPTLSQYGMAIMALLMLGAGLVGFRRFV